MARSEISNLRIKTRSNSARGWQPEDIHKLFESRQQKPRLKRRHGMMVPIVTAGLNGLLNNLCFVGAFSHAGGVQKLRKNARCVAGAEFCDLLVEGSFKN